MEPRIYGPYKHRRRWRIVVYDIEGRRSAQICETYDEATEVVRQLDASLAAGPVVRVGTALERYAAFMAYKGNKPDSITTTTYRLRAFFADVVWEPPCAGSSARPASGSTTSGSPRPPSTRTETFSARRKRSSTGACVIVTSR